jgi:ATP-dependent helicase HrpA
MREWADVYRQLREMVSSSLDNKQQKSNRRIGKIRYCDDDEKLVDDDRYAAIHQSLLAGLLSGVAMAGDKNQYTGAGGLKLFLWPGSGVFAAKPKWIVAAELVETTKQYARTVARIQPQWIEQIGDHVIKRSYHDPHWSSKSGGAFCYQNCTLFGLPIVTRRRVPLPPVDGATARDLLIDHGLAEQQLPTTARFVRHNRSLQDAIAQLAAKTRRRDLVIDNHVLARFYQARLPEDICDRGRLEKYDRALEVPAWTKSLRDAAGIAKWLQSPPMPGDANSLYMRPDDLIDVASETVTSEDFPDELNVGSSRLPLQYRFEPGSERDGVNVKIHQAALPQISDDRLGWLVPGLLQTKLVGMIKSLPKRIRRNLVPAAEVAEQIAEELKDDYGKVPFMTAVCQAMSRHAEVPVTTADFQRDKIDDHFQFLVTVVDDDGATIAEGRDLAPLQQRVGSNHSLATKPATETSDESWSRESTKSFDIDELPREVIRSRGGVQVAQYPGLVDTGEAVATLLFPDLASAEASIRRGTMRLYAIAERKELRNQVRWLPSLEQAKIQLSGVISAADMENALIDLLARIAFVEAESVVRSKDVFESRRGERGQRIAKAAQEVAGWLANMGEHYFSVRRELESLNRVERFTNVISDVRDQLDWLLADPFMSITPWQWLKHYPRYLSAIAYRLDKARGALSRDNDATQSVRDLWGRWLEQLPEDQRNPENQAESEFRWMIEELRVSLFAQPLGTAVKVSLQRCEKLLK